MEKIGDILKNRREELNITIEEISKRTAIRMVIIKAIEDGDYSNLPSYTYVNGFVKNYCEILGISFEEIKPLLVEEFNEYSGNNPEEKKPYKYIKPKTHRISKRSLFIKLLVVLFVFALALNYKYDIIHNIINILTSSEKSSNTRDIITFPSLQPKGSTAGDNNTIDNQTEIEIENSDVKINDNAELTIRSDNISENTHDNKTILNKISPYIAEIFFNDECWIRIRTDMSPIIKDYIAQPNTVISVEFNKTFSIDVGNASAVKVSFGNQIFDKLGEKGRALFNNNFDIAQNNEIIYVREKRDIVFN